MPDEPASPEPTPANYQRTTGGHLRWQPPSTEHLQELLPAYEILGILGKGGMGAVYKGRQRSLDRLVAIKLLPPEAADNDMQFVERFKNEARTMAKMNHPAIVHVYDFGETSDGQLYIVMEYIDGTDVAKMLQSQGKLPPEHALAITAHVCDALQYAHTHGVVHRDIKPANILLNMEGQVKVADFGLAKTADASQAGLTKTNMAMGTPDFVAPEALTPGMSIDGRADLYAVGVMLYNMLTGQVPRGAFRMPSVTSATDVRYDTIIGKAMQMDRELRYQTALDVRRELDVILTTPLAKPGVQTISVKPRDLPQKPVAKSPSTPQQQRAPGSAGVPVRTSQAPSSGPPAKPGAPPVKTGQRAQPHAAPPQKKSNSGVIYGIAASLVVAAAAAFLLPGGGKKPAPKPLAQTANEKPKPAPKPPPPSPPKPADATVQNSAVFTFSGHRYQLITEKFKWDAAKAKAESMGGHLATITSKGEYDWLWGSILSKRKKTELDPNGERSFIGAIQRNPPDGPWEWVTGEPYSYQSWMGNFPNDKNNSVKVATLQSKGWDDVTQNYEALSFLVEWDDTSPAKPAPLTLTGPVNLLAFVDVKRDAVYGDWTLSAEGLLLKQASGMKLLGFNQDLPDEYDFEIEFTPARAF